MKRLIYVILLIPLFVTGQVKIDRDTVFVRDYLFVEDTAEIYGINAGQVTDSSIYLEEPNSGNYFNLKLSSFQPPYLDYYGQDTSGNYYIGGGQGFSTLYYYADSGNGNYMLNYNTLPSAQYLMIETSESAISTYKKYMDQRTNFRTWYVEHYPNGVTSDRAKIELDADFFEVTLQNSTVLNVDTAGKLSIDSLGTKSITLDTTSNPTYKEGKLIYDYNSHTPIFYNDISDFTHNLGYELVKRVYNNSGSTINNGTVVRRTGTYINGNRVPTIGVAGIGSLDSANICGITTVDMPNNTYGIVTIIGDVNQINTSSLSEDQYYLGYAGTLIDTSPEPPNYSVQLGCVVYSDNDSGIVTLLPKMPSYIPLPVYASDSSNINYVVTITSDNQYEYLPLSGLVEKSEIGFQSAGDSIKVLQSGYYHIDMSLSFAGNPTSEVWEYGVFVNNSLEFKKTRSTSSSAYGDGNAIILRYLDANDWISFRIQNTSGTGDPTIEDLSIQCSFIHE